MPTNSYYGLSPSSAELIREDFERCRPGDTFDDLKRRASFSKEGIVAGLDSSGGTPGCRDLGRELTQIAKSNSGINLCEKFTQARSGAKLVISQIAAAKLSQMRRLGPQQSGG